MSSLPEITLNDEDAQRNNVDKTSIPHRRKSNKNFPIIKASVGSIFLLALLVGALFTGHSVGANEEKSAAKRLIESAQAQAMLDAEQMQENHLGEIGIKDEAIFRLENQLRASEASLTQERLNTVMAQEELEMALAEITQLNTVVENAVQPPVEIEAEIKDETAEPETASVPTIQFSIVGTRTVNGVNRVITRFNEELKSVGTNESVDGWTLVSINDQEAIFAKNDVIEKVGL